MTRVPHATHVGDKKQSHFSGLVGRFHSFQKLSGSVDRILTVGAMFFWMTEQIVISRTNGVAVCSCAIE